MRQKYLFMAAALAAMSVGGTAATAPAPTLYKIRDGFTFRDDKGAVLGGGDTIALADDVAEQHLHKLELVEAPAAKPAKTTKASAAKPPAGDGGDAGAGGSSGPTGTGDAQTGTGDAGAAGTDGQQPAG